MRNRLLSAAFGIIALSAASSISQAAVITGLYNTGVDASNVALAGGDGVADSHYIVTGSDIGATVGSAAVTYTHPSYIANDGDSRWVSNSINGNPGNGFVTFALTFDLTGLAASTAIISGKWGVDNIGEIFLNGVYTGNALGSPTDYDAFQALHDFSISSGFLAGLNTLEFKITDAGPPLAFRVDGLQGFAAPVPEPSTWAMMILGFLGVGFVAYRRKQSGPALRIA
jgi:hypothetical protein